LSHVRVTIDGVCIDTSIYLQVAITASLVYTLKIAVIAAHIKSSVFTSRFPVTDPNNVLS
jgi:hypothetical protein